MTVAVDKIRTKIGEVDNQILKLVKQRLQLARKIGEIKKKSNLPIVDPHVEKEVLERALRWSSELGLNESFTVKLIRLLIAEAVHVQENDSK